MPCWPRLLPLPAALLAALALPAHGQSLIDLYDSARGYDATYQGARAQYDASIARAAQARAAILPTVGLTAGVNRSDLDINVITGAQQGSSSRDFTTQNAGINATQPLYRPANWATYQQGKLQAEVAQAVLTAAEQDLIVRVSQAYFDVLASQDSLALVRAQKVAVAEQLASAKRNFEVGTQTITDTHEAQAAYDLVVAQEFAAINDLDNKRAALQVIIGQTPGELAPLRAGVTIAAPEPAAVDPWISSAEGQNFAVISAQLSLEIAKREIARNRANHLPTANLIAQTQHNSVTASGTTKTNSIGVTWNIPIFNGFAITSKVRETIALEDKARNDLESTKRLASQNARQAFLGMNSGLAQVKALEAAELSSKSSLDSNKLGYQVGVRINIDVLNAQRQLYATQRDLSRARYDTIMNGLRLRSAAGTLKEEDLAPVNALLAR